MEVYEFLMLMYCMFVVCVCINLSYSIDVNLAQAAYDICAKPCVIFACTHYY